MIKVIQALQPTLFYLIKLQTYHVWNKKPLTKNLRNEYLKLWGKETLSRMKVHCTVLGKASKKPCILVGNHISYIDMPLLLAQVPAVFVAKKEISSWPVIGHAAKFVGTIFVDRKSKDSRKQALSKLCTKLEEAKEQIAIFPSGTTSIDENVNWRLGAFKAAEEFKIPVQAFRIRYKPKNVAFIGEDVFLPHLHRLLKNKRIEASIEFKNPQLIKNAQKDMESIKKWCMEAI